MKIIIVGASGTIGKRVTGELSKRHEVIRASTTSGDILVDMSDRNSIEQMFKQVGNLDAVVVTAGKGYFGDFNTMTEEDFYFSIRNKMMGQINIVMLGKNYINNDGSFTLTSGILAEDPVKNGVALSMVNGALNSFVSAAAIELSRGLRINVVASGVVEDSPQLFPDFPGHTPIPMDQVIRGYVKSVEGKITGQVIRIY